MGKMWIECILNSLVHLGEKIVRMTILQKGRVLRTANFECTLVFVKLFLLHYFSEYSGKQRNVLALFFKISLGRVWPYI
jgi:hypothetical protein